MPAVIEGKGRDEDRLAYLRDEHAYRNVLLVEQPNGDFAATMVRHLLYAAFMHPYYQALAASSDARLAEIAAKAVKEMAYHVRHAAEWVIRLGDGTEESHARAAAALDELWMYTGELFEMDDGERALAGSRHRRRPRSDPPPMGGDDRSRVSPRRPCSARPTAGCRPAGAPAATASTWARCWPRCRCCTAPIRPSRGELTAPAQPGRPRTREPGHSGKQPKSNAFGKSCTTRRPDAGHASGIPRT